MKEKCWTSKGASDCDPTAGVATAEKQGGDGNTSRWGLMRPCPP